MENTEALGGGNFIHDLDEFFAKKYSDFDLIASMPSYESVTISMILKNKNRIEEGEYAANEMRKISYQPDPAKVLAELKERYVDNAFTFSVRIAPFKKRMAAFFGSKNTVGKLIARLVKNYGEAPETLAEKLGVRFDGRIDCMPLPVRHAEIGAELLRQVIGIEDDDIIEAVRWHTTGRAAMTPIEKVVYLADYIEPLRDFPGVDELRAETEKSVDGGLLAALRNSVEHVGKDALYPATAEAYEYYKEKK